MSFFEPAKCANLRGGTQKSAFVTNLSRIFSKFLQECHILSYVYACYFLVIFAKNLQTLKKARVFNPCLFYISDSSCFLFFRFSSSSLSSSLISSSITWLSSFLLSMELIIFADSIFAEKSRCE